MKALVTVLMLLAADVVNADVVFATRTVRVNTILTDQDVQLRSVKVDGAAENLSQVVGKEARVVLYAGRPIHPEHLSAPALVQRNQVVSLMLNTGGLSISTSGRALDRGSYGETIRVMNLSSRSTLFGIVAADGAIHVNSR